MRNGGSRITTGRSNQSQLTLELPDLDMVGGHSLRESDRRFVRFTFLIDPPDDAARGVQQVKAILRHTTPRRVMPDPYLMYALGAGKRKRPKGI